MIFFRILSVLAILILFPESTFSQLNELGRFKLETRKNRKVVIPFKLINNLIVIPVSINGSDSLNLVLDTGVGTTLITELPENTALGFNYLRTVKVGGLGEGEAVDVLYAPNNTIEIKKAKGEKQDVLVMVEDIFHLSSFLGENVNGLIGYSLFKDFIIEIDYRLKRVILHDHDKYSKKYSQKKDSEKWVVHNFSLIKQKPYIEVNVAPKKGDTEKVKLLIDSGASHAMSLYYSANEKLFLPDSRIQSYLGSGISGEINGYLGRVNFLELNNNVRLQDIVVAYPEEKSIKKALLFSDRDGSIGADVLRRFKIFFNYRDGTMILRPQKNFKEEFSYNLSGIEIVTPYPGIPLYSISHVRKGSIAEQEGLQKDDIILEINGRGSQYYDLNEINKLFQKENSRLRLKIQRDFEKFRTTIRLIDEIK